MTAKDIDKYLRVHYNSAKYLVSNTYCFDPAYKETDFLVINNNGYCYEKTR